MAVRLIVWLCGLAVSGSVHAENVPQFMPVPVAEHVYAGGWEHFVGGGVAAFDCDGDALPELYAAGGTNPGMLLRNTTQGPGQPLSFRENTPDALALTGMTGAYPIDVNSDGWMDLAILRVGPDLLMRGLGKCEFAPFADLNFQSKDHWTTAFSATWEKGNTLPTLAFGTYVDRADPNGPFGTCGDPQLYRPTGSTYQPAQPLTPGFCVLSMLFSDWSRTGRADLRLSNDRHYYVRGGQEQLWEMAAQPRLFTQDDGWQPYAIWGMGIASRDLTGDGFADVYLTSMGDQKFQLFDPEARGPVYRDATYARGTTAHRPHVGQDGRPSTGWHAAFGDVNNDGRDDIFVAKGNVEQMPGMAMEDPNSLLIQGADGTFADLSEPAGIASMARSRGAALVDLNLDGALDLAVVNRRAAMEVYENTTMSGNWLLVSLDMTGSNRTGIGAVIEIDQGDSRHTREVTIGGGHAGGDAGFHHFGLGTAQSVQLRVVWPDQHVGPWQQVNTNQILRLHR